MHVRDVSGAPASVEAIARPHGRRLRHLAATVGVVTPEGRACVGVGRASVAGWPDDAMFEIGSISKVFTATLLADLVIEGRIALDAPIADYLPAAARAGGAGDITPLELATHTSGLARLPDNLQLSPVRMQNPYAAYTVDDLWACLARFRRPPGGIKPAYSNLGAGLLGHVLAAASGTTYEAAVRERVCAPLGMTDTAIGLSPGQRERLVPGYTRLGRRAHNWDLPALAGAGAWRSSVRDMTRFLAACMDPPAGRLGEAMALCRAPRVATADGVSMGLGWVLSRRGARTVVWHNGATGGYNAYIGFVAGGGTGVCVLTNYTVPTRPGARAQADAIGTDLLEALAQP